MKSLNARYCLAAILPLFFCFFTYCGYAQNVASPPENGVPCLPLIPGEVSGPANVCPYLGTGAQLTYSVSQQPDVLSYNWVVPPTVSIVSGQGTKDLTVTISSDLTAIPNKLIRVRGVYACGTGPERLFYLKAQAPTTPKPIIGGSTNICAFVGTNNAVSYQIHRVLGAGSYNWTTPAGTSVSHFNAAGPNDTLVLVTFLNGFTTGDISVSSVNDCGTSNTRSLTIQNNMPSKPGLIGGTTNVCAHIAPSGTALTYTVSPVQGATFYNWTAPAGSVITHPNGTGQSDFSITVLFPDSFVSGAITVASGNGCGTSDARSLAINTLNPSAPGAITGTEISACPSRVYSYSIQGLPFNGNSINWEVPAGGIILNGQGSLSITVIYSSTAIEGNIGATAISDCGSSKQRKLPVSLEDCSSGRAASAFARSAGISPQITSGIMVLNVVPNPSVGDFRVRVSSKENTPISLNILDLSGRLLKRIAVRRNETAVFGNDLKPGNYIMEVIQGTERRIQKLVKL